MPKSREVDAAEPVGRGGGAQGSGGGARGGRGLLAGLARSCHPAPTLAVTAISAGLAALAGVALGRGVLLTAAVLTGQLSIGWSNDRIDAARDRAVHRPDKPLAAGAVPAGAVSAAALVSLLATVGLSLALGLPAGLSALTVTACGWLYNAGLKATAGSFLPYAIAFGVLPAVATRALPGHPWPAPWAMAAGALLGVSAHFANVLPDLAEDAATGVRGLPHRLGARGTAVGGSTLLWLASMVILFGGGSAGRETTPGGSVGRWAAAGLLTALAAAGALTGWRRPSSRVLFPAILVIAAADVALFAAFGWRLT